jgi:hypothetical protein
MMLRSTVVLAAMVLASGVAAADDLKSGPQVGEGISGKFLLQCANGKYGGKKICPV